MGVEEVRSRVQRMLAELLGSVRVGGNGSFIVENGSTVTFVDVIEWGEGSSLVRIYGALILDVPLTPDLYEWVATEGQRFHFGACRVIPGAEPGTGIVEMSHTLLADYLDKDELMAAIAGVAGSGDDLDDELQARFGGRRFTDPAQ
jgi:hypothetical protein